MEKKNRCLVVAVVVLAICVLGLGGYLIYDKVLSKDNNTNNVETNNNELEKSLSASEVEALGKKIYENTNISPLLDNYNYENLSNKDRLEIAIKQEITSLPSCYDGNDENAHENGYWHCQEYWLMSKKVFELLYHNLYGNDKEIKYENFELDLFYQDGMVNITGNDLTIEYTERVIEDACYTTNDLIKTEYEDNILYLYIEEYGLCDGEEDTKKYDAKTYKLAFKQDTNDNYYWYSTELVK